MISLLLQSAGPLLPHCKCFERELLSQVLLEVTLSQFLCCGAVWWWCGGVPVYLLLYILRLMNAAEHGQESVTSVSNVQVVLDTSSRRDTACVAPTSLRIHGATRQKSSPSPSSPRHKSRVLAADPSSCGVQCGSAQTLFISQPEPARALTAG